MDKIAEQFKPNSIYDTIEKPTNTPIPTFDHYQANKSLEYAPQTEEEFVDYGPAQEIGRYLYHKTYPDKKPNNIPFDQGLFGKTPQYGGPTLATRDMRSATRAMGTPKTGRDYGIWLIQQMSGFNNNFPRMVWDASKFRNVEYGYTKAFYDGWNMFEKLPIFEGKTSAMAAGNMLNDISTYIGLTTVGGAVVKGLTRKSVTQRLKNLMANAGTRMTPAKIAMLEGGAWAGTAGASQEMLRSVAENRLLSPYPILATTAAGVALGGTLGKGLDLLGRTVSKRLADNPLMNRIEQDVTPQPESMLFRVTPDGSGSFKSGVGDPNADFLQINSPVVLDQAVMTVDQISERLGLEAADLDFIPEKYGDGPVLVPELLRDPDFAQLVSDGGYDSIIGVDAVGDPVFMPTKDGVFKGGISNEEQTNLLGQTFPGQRGSIGIYAEGKPGNEVLPTRIMQTTTKDDIEAKYADRQVPPSVKIADHLQEQALEHNRADPSLVDVDGRAIYNEENVEPLSDRLVAEYLSTHEASRQQGKVSAVDWYRENLDEAHRTVSQVHPEVAQDPQHATAFNYGLAITSNGTKVSDNAATAMKIYEDWKANGGRYSDNMIQEVRTTTGKEGNTIADQMILHNEMSDRLGQERFYRLLETDVTVSQIKQMGFDAKGEAADEVLPFSLILGPKIGGGFFTNLQGRWDLPTFDRWWMKTWGRHTGTLSDFTPEKQQFEYERLLKAVKKAPKFAERFGYDPAFADDPQKMFDWATRAESQWARAGYPNKNYALVTSMRAIGKWQKAIEGPRNTKERKYMRQVVHRAVAKLDDLGHNTDAAAVQATVWFPEQTLWDHLGSKQPGKENDYAKAFRRIVGDRRQPEGTGSTAVAGGTGLEGRNSGERGFVEDGRISRKGRRVITHLSFNDLRSSTGLNPEKASGAYRRRDRGGTGSLRVLGLPAVAQYTPSVKLRNLGNSYEQNPFTQKFFEVEPSEEAAEKFHAAILKGKESHGVAGNAVYVYDQADYQGMRMFLSEDGTSGFAIKPDGDIVSVFNTVGQSPAGQGSAMIHLAVQAGGKKLDAFDTVLPDIYASAGFRPVARTAWNDAYWTPDQMTQFGENPKWAKYNGGRPDVIYMVYDPTADKMADQYTDVPLVGSEDQAAALQEKAMSEINYD